jgi:hypothetical protein
MMLSTVIHSFQRAMRRVSSLSRLVPEAQCSVNNAVISVTQPH